MTRTDHVMQSIKPVLEDVANRAKNALAVTAVLAGIGVLFASAVIYTGITTVAAAEAGAMVGAVAGDMAEAVTLITTGAAGTALGMLGMSRVFRFIDSI